MQIPARCSVMFKVASQAEIISMIQAGVTEKKYDLGEEDIEFVECLDCKERTVTLAAMAEHKKKRHARKWWQFWK